MIGLSYGYGSRNSEMKEGRIGYGRCYYGDGDNLCDIGMTCSLHSLSVAIYTSPDVLISMYLWNLFYLPTYLFYLFHLVYTYTQIDPSF